MLRKAEVVLHLDDDFDFTRIVHERLKKSKIETHCEHNPKNWQKRILQLNAGIILLDMEMGLWNGLEILEQIRKMDGDRRVIMLTGNMNTSTVIQALSLGADFCFFKSEFEFQELTDAINMLQFRRFHWSRAARVASDLRRAQREAGDVVAQFKGNENLGATASSVSSIAGNYRCKTLSEAFPRYLLEAANLPLDALVKAVEYSDRQRPLLGQIGMEMGKLDLRQIFQIVEEQASSREPFGQVAVRLGFLTPQDVDMLLQAQRQRRLDVGAALVSTGALTQEQLERYQAEFRRYSATLRGENNDPAIEELSVTA